MRKSASRPSLTAALLVKLAQRALGGYWLSSTCHRCQGLRSPERGHHVRTNPSRPGGGNRRKCTGYRLADLMVGVSESTVCAAFAMTFLKELAHRSLGDHWRYSGLVRAGTVHSATRAGRRHRLPHLVLTMSEPAGCSTLTMSFEEKLAHRSLGARLASSRRSGEGSNLTFSVGPRTQVPIFAEPFTPELAYRAAGSAARPCSTGQHQRGCSVHRATRKSARRHRLGATSSKLAGDVGREAQG
mmetsp:Transcript_10751/g.22950  ORF Transcript_10751/g.22950 Transcript_10751/m.22950 type:complete len:243 (+) Transcript_10751:402-1130(+)